MEGEMRVGLLGCGNIGGVIAKAIDGGGIGCKLVSVFDKDVAAARSLSDMLNEKPKISKSVRGLLQNTDLVVEAASQEAVRDYGEAILNSGKDLIVMSVGVFADNELFSRLKKIADARGRSIRIPSGAIAGLDGIRAAKEGGIESVELTTRKPPGGLGVVSGKKKVLYDGPARKGISKFPKNVNIAATLSLAGIGFDKTRLRIVADPGIERNVHEIKVRGAFGEFEVIMKNYPSPDNPKTSYLAALSAIAALRETNSGFRVGE